MAIIYVSPTTDITALISSQDVSPGDVLLLEDGIYYQTVIITKNYVRIVAQGCEAVFDGNNTLIDGFILQNVIGVEINGIQIKNYLNDGIRILNGSANRILNNSINDVSNHGILLLTTQANLVWKNQIFSAFDGVQLRLGSTNNWIIQNLAQYCRDDGFESFLSPEINNAFICNTAANNGGNGFEIFAANNLLFYNVVKENESVGIYVSSIGNNSLMINNQIEGNIQDGIFMVTNNNLVSENQMKCNPQSGIEIQGDYNSVQYNEIDFNENYGVLLGAFAEFNFIYKNQLVCNTPDNINDGGQDNILFENIEKPCH